MGNEVKKVIDEQTKAQNEIKGESESNFDMKIIKSIMSSGPSWFDATDKTVNFDLLAAEVIDELEITRQPAGYVDLQGKKVSDNAITDVFIDKLSPYFPEKASRMARFDVLPVFHRRLAALPVVSVSTDGNGMGSYMSGKMQEEIRAFVAASNIKTGFYRFDELAGGLYPGLYVIGAISSLGKTTFVQQLADNVAAAGKPVLFFSLEMSRLEMASKSISRKTAQIDFPNAVSSLKIRAGITSRVVQEAIEAYKSSVGDLMNVIEGGFDTTVDSITDYTRAYIDQHGQKPVVIVDYLQIIQGAEKGTIRESIDYNVVELKRLARALDVPVIVISSINRGNYLLPVDFESFKESGGIEYTADVVLGLQLACLDDNAVFQKEKAIMEKREAIKAAKAENPRQIRLVCLKNRYGRPDWTITYKYYPQYDYFVETTGYTEVNAETLKGAERL